LLRGLTELHEQTHVTNTLVWFEKITHQKQCFFVFSAVEMESEVSFTNFGRTNRVNCKSSFMSYRYIFVSSSRATALCCIQNPMAFLKHSTKVYVKSLQTTV